MSAIEKAIDCAIRARKYGSLITETFELARSQSERALACGLVPFPIVIKDCFTVRDVPTTCASKMLQDFVPTYSATVVERLVKNGGCIIGKGNLDEFSMGTSSVLGHFGPVKSGLTDDVDDDWYVPGGSSGGPAVAVQLGLAEMAIGSDTGGSTRNPAAFNGIFGLKPTYGSLSRYGLIPLVNSFDSPAIFSRSASGCRKWLNMIAGVDPHDPTSIDLEKTGTIHSLKGLRIGIPVEYHNEFLTDDSWRVWNRAANVLRDAGAELRTVSLPLTRHSLNCYQVVSAVDITSNMARYDGVAYGHRSKTEPSTLELYANSRSESLNTVVRRRIMAGNYFLMRKHRDLYSERGARIRRLIRNELVSVFDSVDLLLTPSAAGPAPRFSDLRDGNFKREDHDDFYTQPANIAGIPAISIPFGESETGLPIGVQLAAAPRRDYFLCDIAQLLYDCR